MKIKKNRIYIKEILLNKKNTNTTKLFIIDKLDKIVNAKRIFFICSKSKDLRGDHGHKKCKQVFISIKGIIKIETFDGFKKEFFFLQPFKTVLEVQPLVWVKVHFNSNQTLMVLCDKYFSERDYIYNLKDFIKYRDGISKKIY